MKERLAFANGFPRAVVEQVVMAPAAVQVLAAWLQRHMPGAGLAGLIAIAATSVSALYGGPQFVYALAFGVAFQSFSHGPRTRCGIDWCARGLLRLGVGLLGARISIEQIVGLGAATALVVVAGVLTTVGLGLLAGRWLRLTSAQSVLSGVAVAICGASAALAVSAVLPREKDGERFTLMVVVAVTVFSTVAMVLYPLVARLLHLPPALAGLFLGGTIHDVAQVVGAGYTLGHETGDIATVVKLFRVAMLAGVVLVVSLAFQAARQQTALDHHQSPPLAKHSPMPWFLWLFAGLVLLTSTGRVPAGVQQALNLVSGGSLVVAIAALGMKTSFRQLAQAGWRPVALIAIETLWLAGFVLACVVVRRA